MFEPALTSRPSGMLLRGVAGCTGEGQLGWVLLAPTAGCGTVVSGYRFSNWQFLV